MSHKVSFIGLGVMGYPMAGYISKAGHDVTVYNRTSAKANKWAETFRGITTSTPAEAAKDADFIFTCVGNDDDLKEVTIGDFFAQNFFKMEILTGQCTFMKIFTPFSSSFIRFWDEKTKPETFS